MTSPIENHLTDPPIQLGSLGEGSVHPIQPYQARKVYLCPGCDSAINVGVGHLVVTPVDEPDLRRHWHRGCWYKERRRLGHHRSR